MIDMKDYKAPRIPRAQHFANAIMNIVFMATMLMTSYAFVRFLVG